ncbi:unnamed protein product [Amoebophrya sp. A25]|nr:unnamed protein product [Amoebophrya sp. A25]|eukprot:GSA25T00024099001.1
MLAVYGSGGPRGGLLALQSGVIVQAVLTWINAIGLFVVAHIALQSEGLKRADEMIMAGTSDGDGVPVSLRLTFLCVLAGSVALLFGSLAACFGSAMKRRLPLVIFVFISFFVGLFYLASVVIMEDMKMVVVPTMKRQIAEMCEPDMYQNFVYQLEMKNADLTCELVSRPTEPPQSGYSESGRRLLARPSTSKSLQAATGKSETRRLSEDEDGKKKKKVVPPPLCGALCDERVKLIKAMGGCKTLKYMCEATTNGTPAVAERVEYYADFVSGYCGAFAIFIFLNGMSGTWLLYALVTGRVGKKAGGVICWKILFPCCAPTRSTADDGSKWSRSALE